MAAELSALNSLWRQQGLPAVGLRIGIHTGPVLVGTLGGSQRVKYTSVGNTVNVASRLESFDKELSAPDPTGNPCRILVSEATRRHLGEQFTAEKIADTRLRGQSQSTSIYTVTGPGKGVAREETEGGMA
jgi:adenylate cyclase